MGFKAGHVPWNKGYGEYMTGEKNYFFGKTHTKEAREKISESGTGRKPWNKGLKMWSGKMPPRTGKSPTLETRKKISKSLLGTIPWNKGLELPRSEPANERIKDRRERIRFRDKLQKVVFERDGYTCQVCGSRGVDLQVDHIQSWAEYIELRFNISNCRTLCKECHYKITFGKPMKDRNMPWGHNLKGGGLQ